VLLALLNLMVRFYKQDVCRCRRGHKHCRYESHVEHTHYGSSSDILREQG